MSRPPGGTLYSPAFLSLAVELSRYPYDDMAPFQGQATSRTCGSSIRLSFDDDLRSVGLQVTACAVGQAAATIFARHCANRNAADMAAMPGAIGAWLDGITAMPEWPDLEILQPAIAYPARHGAILLPWRAAVDALGKADGTR
ncbi:iron-sulfur cluster assembly scaffold protein [Qipengyuania seohaensis]|uniref:iron-sulfur cluster assembly scaffold protein n=1 Tax=Qipengyuania seohaensis TaxID=266951 RepID=UPI000C22B13E|nr:iron-sulfur cluster assembly scaffold protein [Qipengyuania seohaensis]